MVISETFENDFDSGNDFNSRTQYGNSYARLVRTLIFYIPKKKIHKIFLEITRVATPALIRENLRQIMRQFFKETNMKTNFKTKGT